MGGLLKLGWRSAFGRWLELGASRALNLAGFDKFVAMVQRVVRGVLIVRSLKDCAASLSRFSEGKLGDAAARGGGAGAASPPTPAAPAPAPASPPPRAAAAASTPAAAPLCLSRLAGGFFHGYGADGKYERASGWECRRCAHGRSSRSSIGSASAVGAIEKEDLVERLVAARLSKPVATTRSRRRARPRRHRRRQWRSWAAAVPRARRLAT